MKIGEMNIILIDCNAVKFEKKLPGMFCSNDKIRLTVSNELPTDETKIALIMHIDFIEKSVLFRQMWLQPMNLRTFLRNHFTKF